MDAEGLLPLAQAPTACTIPEPDQSSQRLLISLFDPFE